MKSKTNLVLLRQRNLTTSMQPSTAKQKIWVPANGNAKDAAKLPYDELSEANKRKDYEAVALLLEQF